MTFEQFAEPRVGMMLRTAQSLCRDRALAEDLVQEVLVQLRRRWRRASVSPDPEAYVRRLLVREQRSWHRTRARLAPTAEADPADQTASEDAERRLRAWILSGRSCAARP